MRNEILTEKINQYTKAYKDEVILIRRQLHQIPEIGDNLPKTRALILNELKKYDIEIQENVGNNGIVAIIRGGLEGKTVAYRADMDALLILEQNDLEYKSKHEGKMHACGHDAHVAIALSITKVLSLLKNDIKGNIKVIFQPAEETSGGALNMINDGVLDNPKVDYILGSHMWPSIESGKLGLCSGPLMAGTDILEINIQGKGGHGGIPHNAINPIVVGSKIINEIESIKNYFIDSSERAVISICSINSGTTNNVIPNTATILGTVRSFSKDTQEIIIDKLRKIANNISDIYGAKCELIYKKNFPPTINNAYVIDEIKKELKNHGLEDSINHVKEASMGAEDFSYFLNQIPGAFIFIGTRNESKNITHEIHNPNFKIDEEVLEFASATLCKMLLAFLEK